ncbi:hypothetical protein ELH26_36495 [Rhizobium leguminosarum]|jgi:hypothetical protein|uniref:DUF3606 domain-containing protein n=1 Tax=Rhizobium beringeri TaxID=3019934 RepID=A0ABY1XIR2_9HYPH|nr:hypothetical protein [Rhizobium leguminosarum bv. viciae]RWX07199.1 hypothetical protein EHI45_26270 [Rhizobium leguminosarum]TBE58357.1 hypothetical protein ELH03_35680 [Rhizobium beringeri]TAU37893.1 hypothetical protein ELI43_31430 [Rhizobium leguminosarum]TBC54827.1 hypothetical protein ELH27_35525 [Rhizobium leguminosarum]
MMKYPATDEYSNATLCRHYGLAPGEAERLMTRFGRSKEELDRLLAARGRTPRHRKRELAISEVRAPFGI